MDKSRVWLFMLVNGTPPPMRRSSIPFLGSHIWIEMHGRLIAMEWVEVIQGFRVGLRCGMRRFGLIFPSC